METKDLIIETAFLAFIEHGYDRVSLNQIIKNTGLTKGAFYHNFSSKSELIQEVMRRYFFTHLNRTIEQIDGSGVTFSEKLKKIYMNVMNVDISLQAYPDIHIEQDSFMHLFQECMESDEQLREMSTKHEKITMDIMTKVVEDAMNNNEIRKGFDSNKIAELINAMVRGTMVSSSFLSREETELKLQVNIETLLELMTT